jgi:RNA polymerase primary sigma factor
MTANTLAGPSPNTPAVAGAVTREVSIPRQPARVRRRRGRPLPPEDVVCYPKYRRLSYFDEMTLVRRAQQGDVAARNRLWAQHARLVYSVVNQFFVPEALLPDAIQEGMLGLHRAIQKFEISHLAAFSTYAWHWVRQYISRYLLQQVHLVPVPSSLATCFYGLRKSRLYCLTNSELDACESHWRELGGNAYISTRDILRLCEAHSLSQVARRDHPRLRVPDAVNCIDHSAFLVALRSLLPQRMYRVIELRYGLNGEPELTLEQVGEQLHVSRERVRQIQIKAEARIQRHLKCFADARRSELDLEPTE